MNSSEISHELSGINTTIWEKVKEFSGIDEINDTVADKINEQAKDVGGINSKLSTLVGFIRADKMLLDDSVKQSLASIESRIAVIQDKLAGVPILLTTIITARSVNPFSDGKKTQKYINARSSIAAISKSIDDARWGIKSVLVA